MRRRVVFLTESFRHLYIKLDSHIFVMPKKRVVKPDFSNQQSFIHKEFELVSMAGRCVAGLAPVDDSRIIQPVSTKMMKNCTADFKKNLWFKIIALVICSMLLCF